MDDQEWWHATLMAFPYHHGMDAPFTYITEEIAHAKVTRSLQKH